MTWGVCVFLGGFFLMRQMQMGGNRFSSGRAGSLRTEESKKVMFSELQVSMKPRKSARDHRVSQG